jgi:hypothetical protein
MITDLRVFPIGYITELLSKLTWEFEQKCPYHHDRDEVNIYMPKILQMVLREDIIRERNFNLPIDRATFRGYNILPGYEYSKIIIAHERYPESNDPRLYHSVDVVESVDLKDKPKQFTSPSESV